MTLDSAHCSPLNINLFSYLFIDSTVVKFAPETFKDRYKYIGLDETKADVDLMNAYMNDKTGSVKNPGLKEGIRETVVATWKVEDLWLRDKTELTQYLVWRFIGTADGVFRITPGSLSEKSYDPRQRPWLVKHTIMSGLVSLPRQLLSASKKTVDIIRSYDDNTC